MKTVKKFTAMRAGPVSPLMVQADEQQMNLPLERHIHILAPERDYAPEMIAAFQTDSSLHLIATYAAYGSLWDRMCSLGNTDKGETSQAGKMAEDEIRWWARQMTGAIDWLHRQGFVHR